MSLFRSSHSSISFFSLSLSLSLSSRPWTFENSRKKHRRDRGSIVFSRPRRGTKLIRRISFFIIHNRNEGEGYKLSIIGRDEIPAPRHDHCTVYNYAGDDYSLPPSSVQSWNRTLSPRAIRSNTRRRCPGLSIPRDIPLSFHRLL